MLYFISSYFLVSRVGVVSSDGLHSAIQSINAVFMICFEPVVILYYIIKRLIYEYI